MRKLLLTVILIMFLMALPVCAHAWEWTLDSDGTLEISGSGAVEDFDAASATPWYGKTVKQVIVHEGITALGRNAFRNCNRMCTATLPNSLEKLGVSTFEGCSALKTVTFGTGLRTMEAYAFQDCTALTGVYITDIRAWCAVEVPAYNSSPMYYAKMLYVNGQPLSGRLEIPSGVTKIPKYAFYGCEGITELYLPNTVTSIESDAFTYCSGLAVADLGGAKQIGSAAFSYCTALVSVSMQGTENLGDYAFAYCGQLENIMLPNGLKQIGQRAFYDCASLKELQLPSSLNALGDYAFYNCAAIKAVSIPQSLTVIPAYAFYNCTALAELSLPLTVTDIQKRAFSGCTGLAGLTLPASLKTLGNYAFYNCTGLQEIRLEAVAMEDLKAGNNVFYKAGQPGLVVSVAAAVTHIPAYLFYPYSTYNPNVTRVVFEKGSVCKTIGKYAFANCKTLQEVVFSGAAPAIEANAFNKVTAQCLYPAFWDSGVLQNYGGTLTWIPLLVEAQDGTLYKTFTEALNSSNRLRLLGDAEIDTVLGKDLYLDLNGYDLSGKLENGGYRIFGMDSTTDGYDDQNAGTLRCTGAVPEVHHKDHAKRYLTVKTEEGYTFHRFYIGITHMTLRPGQQGVGFKASFYADQTVRAQIVATGYTLGLEGYSTKTQWKNRAYESGSVITMLVRNFDAEQYGETPLSAKLCIQLRDGTVIESSVVTMTLRSMMEQISADMLSDVQKQQIAQWIKSCSTMGKWNIEKLLV